MKWGGSRVNLSGLQALGIDAGSTVGQCTTLPPPAVTNTPAPTPTPLPSRTMSHTSATPVTTQAGASVTPDPDSLVREPADFNCDGRVTMVDAMRIMKIVSGARTNWGCRQQIDVDCDGALTPRDALEVLIGLSKDLGNEVHGCPLDPS